MNRFMVISTDSVLHQEGHVTDICDSLELAKLSAIEMMKAKGPSRMYIAKIMSHCSDSTSCEFKDIEDELNG